MKVEGKGHKKTKVETDTETHIQYIQTVEGRVTHTPSRKHRADQKSQQLGCTCMRVSGCWCAPKEIKCGVCSIAVILPFKSMQLIWSVCFMDVQQMEQLVSHSVVVKTRNTQPPEHMYCTARRRSQDIADHFLTKVYLSAVNEAVEMF